MTDTQSPTDLALNTQGIPDPANFRVHRKMPVVFAEGAALPATADTVTEVIPIAGALLVRGRLKFTCAGALSFRYRRPPDSVGTAYDATAYQPPNADVAVVAD